MYVYYTLLPYGIAASGYALLAMTGESECHCAQPSA